MQQKKSQQVSSKKKTFFNNNTSSSSRSVSVRDMGRFVIPRTTTLRGDGMSVRAFTLIELLVVVLIIGILAAVAIPQYQKAVEKAKAAQVLPLLRSVYQAAEVYYQANGTWPTDLESLDVNIPWTGKRNWYSLGHHTQGLSNEDWSIQLRRSGGTQGNARGVVVGRLSGPYAGAGFYIHKVSPYSVLPSGAITCVESAEPYVYQPFSKKEGDFCIKVMNGTFVPTSDAMRHYTLPL